MPQSMSFLAELKPVHGILFTHFLTTCALAWHGIRAAKASDRWQGVAQGLLRQKNLETAKTRVWGPSKPRPS